MYSVGRVTLFRNGVQAAGVVVMLPNSMQELLHIASQKLHLDAKFIYTTLGGKVDDIALVCRDDILYVTEGEPFAFQINKSHCNAQALGKSLLSLDASGDCKGSTINEPELLKFNVGGEYFFTTRSTYCKEPISVLAKLFDHEAPSLDENGAHFFGRDPDYFKALLCYLRYGKVKAVHPGVPIDNDAFFGLQLLVNAMESEARAKGEKRVDVTLNVGGISFCTLWLTLPKVPPSLLAKLLE